jgi:hypothetical protein
MTFLESEKAINSVNLVNLSEGALPNIRFIRMVFIGDRVQVSHKNRNSESEQISTAVNNFMAEKHIKDRRMGIRTNGSIKSVTKKHFSNIPECDIITVKLDMYVYAVFFFSKVGRILVSVVYNGEINIFCYVKDSIEVIAESRDKSIYESEYPKLETDLVELDAALGEGSNSLVSSVKSVIGQQSAAIVLTQMSYNSLAQTSRKSEEDLELLKKKWVKITEIAKQTFEKGVRNEETIEELKKTAKIAVGELVQRDKEITELLDVYELSEKKALGLKSTVESLKIENMSLKEFNQQLEEQLEAIYESEDMVATHSEQSSQNKVITTEISTQTQKVSSSNISCQTDFKVEAVSEKQEEKVVPVGYCENYMVRSQLKQFNERWFGFRINDTLKNLLLTVGETLDILKITDVTEERDFIRVKLCLRELCVITRSRQYIWFCRQKAGPRNLKENKDQICDFAKCFLIGLDKTLANFMKEVTCFSLMTGTSSHIFAHNNVRRVVSVLKDVFTDFTM